VPESLAGRDEETRLAIDSVAGVFDAEALTSAWKAALEATAWDREPA
jgi:hypothetical protein